MRILFLFYQNLAFVPFNCLMFLEFSPSHIIPYFIALWIFWCILHLSWLHLILSSSFWPFKSWSIYGLWISLFLFHSYTRTRFFALFYFSSSLMCSCILVTYSIFLIPLLLHGTICCSFWYHNNNSTTYYSQNNTIQQEPIKILEFYMMIIHTQGHRQDW